MTLKSRSGFTLVEIMVVLLIVGFLMAFIGPRLIKRVTKSQRAMTELLMKKLKASLLEYKTDIGHYPTRQEGGLNALLTQPTDSRFAAKWDGPYVDDEGDLFDKWDEPFEYNVGDAMRYARERGFRYFEIISRGGQEVDAKEIVDGV